MRLGGVVGPLLLLLAPPWRPGAALLTPARRRVLPMPRGGASRPAKLSAGEDAPKAGVAPERRAGLAVAATAAIGSLLHGYDTGVIAGALLFIVPEFGLAERPALKGLVVSSTTVGAILGTLAAGPAAERLGQKRTMLLGSAVFLLGGLLLAWSPTLGALVAGRFVVGLAMGTAGAVVPVYIAECVASADRGRLATIPQLFITTGIFLSYVVDLAIILLTQNGWRFMLGCSVLPAVVQLLALSRLPESPRWLLRRGRRDDALAALRRLRGQDPGARPPRDDPVAREFALLEKAAAPTGAGASLEGHARGGWAALLRPGVRRVLFICMSLQMFQQITGINTIIYYTPEILREAGVMRIFDRFGFTENAASMGATLLAYLPKPFAVLAASTVMDSVGRRGLLLRCLPLMGLCLAMLAATFTVLPAGSLIRAVTAVLSVSLFGVAFSFSLGPIPNIISSEMLPNDARALGMSVSTGTQWLFNALLVMVFPILTHRFGTQNMIAFFASMCAVAYFFTRRFVPETAGKSLEESSAAAAATA